MEQGINNSVDDSTQTNELENYYNQLLNTIQSNDRTQIIMNDILNFFDQAPHKTKLLNILAKKTISLSLIDWFVTVYSRENPVIYPMNEDGETFLFNVRTEYCAQLKNYNKRLFDPFRRKQRIKLYTNIKKWANYYDEDKNVDIVDNSDEEEAYTGKDDVGTYLITTISQLNFFKWAIKNKVIEYIETHAEQLAKTSTKSKKNKTNPLHISKVITTQKFNLTVSFN
jgi:hypothetical protein